MNRINNAQRNLRNRFLVSVSVATLLAWTGNARAADTDGDRPPLWIELGGQFDQFSGQGNPFTPSFVTATDWHADSLTSPAAIQDMHFFSLGGDASISLQPADSDWVFSASVRYGRAHGHKFVHQQKTLTTRFPFFGKYLTKSAPASYAQTSAAKSESHFIVDFQAGKDVGLGLFGQGSASEIGFGIRFARLNERAEATLRARPGIYFIPGTIFGSPFPLTAGYHRYYATGQRASSFHGVGPSISWSASVPIAGNMPDGEITIDWGANAAMLFGRQRTKAAHHTTGSYHYFSGKYQRSAALPPGAGHRDQSKSVVVPDLGGFAGLSFRYAAAKVSFGYRADYFFGVLDTRIGKRKSTTMGFHGPFASISIGLGD